MLGVYFNFYFLFLLIFLFFLLSLRCKVASLVTYSSLHLLVYLVLLQVASVTYGDFVKESVFT